MIFAKYILMILYNCNKQFKEKYKQFMNKYIKINYIFIFNGKPYR